MVYISTFSKGLWMSIDYFGKHHRVVTIIIEDKVHENTHLIILKSI